jgi:hypothetical protein
MQGDRVNILGDDVENLVTNSLRHVDDLGRVARVHSNDGDDRGDLGDELAVRVVEALEVLQRDGAFASDASETSRRACEGDLDCTARRDWSAGSSM